MKWTASYILSAVAVNALFLLVPPISIGGVMIAPGSFVVGATFILRDYAQRDLGHYVLLATVLATMITATMSPGLALASGTAFLLSELLDWAVFSRLPGSFSRRVFWSSVVGAPVDSIVFMTMAGFFSWPGVLVMTLSKLVALAYLAIPKKTVAAR